MQDVLLKYPNESFELLDDDDARTFLIAEGLFGDFPQGSFTGSRGQFLIFKRHPSHWILAIRFQGNKNKSDNGYVVYCEPKSKVTLKDVEDLSKEIQKHTKTADAKYVEKNINPNRN